MRIVLDLQACQTEGSKHRGIGRYSIALAEAMLRRGGHDFFVVLNGAFPEAAVAVRERLSGLLPADRIRTYDIMDSNGQAAPHGSWREEANLRLREDFITALRPDAIHVTSLFEGLGDLSITDIPPQGDGILRAVTLYDLIPYIHPDPYLLSPQVRRWYYRRLQSLKRADLLLAISSSSRMEAIDYLDISGDRVVNISSAIDPAFVPIGLSSEGAKALRKRMGITNRFVMYTGGVDHRKNLEGLIKAYALLKPALRHGRQLAIICSINGPQSEALRAVAKEAGLRPEELVLTGFVSEEDLIALYNMCELFVFPSLHEGFGLPALEAMTCGAPTIGSNRSSIPEVIGHPEALFDPTDAQAIADKIRKVLTDPAFADMLRRHGLEHSRQFHWDKSAERAIAAIEHLKAAQEQDERSKPRCAVPSSQRSRLALVSPFPPLKSGIAKYSIDLLPELCRYYDVDLITDEETVQDDWAIANCDIVSIKDFERRAEMDIYQRIVYQLGNSEFHAHMPDLLARYPGVVVLHDFYLSGMQNWRQSTTAPGAFFSALLDTHGYCAIQTFVSEGISETIRRFPSNGPVLDGATGLIVHSRWSEESLAQSGIAPAFIRRVPLPRRHPTMTRAEARDRLNLDDDDILICSFGGTAPEKLNHELFEAFALSTTSRLPHVRLVYVGTAGGDYGKELTRRIRTKQLKRKVSMTGYVDENDYQAYLSAADIAVQLRTDSRGETSAAALDALNNGLVLIANAHGTMTELDPNSLVMMEDKVDIDILAKHLTRLVEDTVERERLSKAAIAAMADHRLEAAGGAYHEAIEAFYADHPRVRQRRLLRSAAMDGRRLPATRLDLVQFAAAATQNMASMRPPRTFVDISGIVVDSGQERARWALGIVETMILNDGRRDIEPVYMRSTETIFRAARSFLVAHLGCPIDGMDDTPIQVAQGDRFIGLDPTAHSAGSEGARALFKRWKAHAVPVFHAVRMSDIPSMDTSGAVGDENIIDRLNWLRGIADAADEVVTWSQEAAEAVRTAFDTIGYSRRRRLSISYPALSLPEGKAGKGLPEQDWRLTWEPALSHWFGGADPRLNTLAGERNGEFIRSTGETGILVYGPYLPLAAGSYEVRIWGSARDVQPGQAHFDVSCNSGTKTIARTAIRPQDKGPILASLSITLDTSCPDLEVRVILDAAVEMAFSGMDIRTASATAVFSTAAE
jgi:glycosyltransferase involved in cell wall biosynthesis